MFIKYEACAKGLSLSFGYAFSFGIVLVKRVTSQNKLYYQDNANLVIFGIENGCTKFSHLVWTLDLLQDKRAYQKM